MALTTGFLIRQESGETEKFSRDLLENRFWGTPHMTPTCGEIGFYIGNSNLGTVRGYWGEHTKFPNK